MQILQFVKSLLPKIGKDRLQENINICKNEMANAVLPSYETAEKHLTTLVSKEAKNFERIWYAQVKTAKKNGLVPSIKLKLQEVQKTVDMIETFSQKEFQEEIYAEGITALKANLIRLVEVADFTSTFALKFLNYLYVLETEATTGQPGYVGRQLTPGEIQILQKHFIEFALAINVLSRNDPKSTEKLLRAIPDVLVNERAQAAIAATGETKLDPLGAYEVKGFSANPIFHIGTFIAEIQANRYKRAKELKSILELRMLNLTQIQAGSPEAVTEKEIEVLQARIDDLDEKIRKAEESIR